MFFNVWNFRWDIKQGKKALIVAWGKSRKIWVFEVHSIFSFFFCPVYEIDNMLPIFNRMCFGRQMNLAMHFVIVLECSFA